MDGFGDNIDQANLPYLDQDALLYRTPRAGEEFRTQVFEEDITVLSRNLRSITGWKLGAQIETPQPDDRLALPAGALYLWHHPDDRHLLRGEVDGIYNNLFCGFKPDGCDDFEVGLTLNNFTCLQPGMRSTMGLRIAAKKFTGATLDPV